MKTKIYKTYQDFLKREDKKENGVSESFAAKFPDYEEKNKTNARCWNCSDCSDCIGCIGCRGCHGCSGCRYCSDCSDCSDCIDCIGCRGCHGCSGCSGCRYCSDCSGCIGCSDEQGDLVFPVIPNIHQAVLEATTKTDTSLNMSTWHTCDTTHCRAGWVVTLAGEAGLELEKKTSTAFAAAMIYKASSPIRVHFPRFYEDNETAMADIIRCAEEEKALSN